MHSAQHACMAEQPTAPLVLDETLHRQHATHASQVDPKTGVPVGQVGMRLGTGVLQVAGRRDAQLRGARPALIHAGRLRLAGHKRAALHAHALAGLHLLARLQLHVRALALVPVEAPLLRRQARLHATLNDEGK